MSKLEDFKKRSLDWANTAPKPEEDNYRNTIDDDHTPLWQLVGFCDEEVFGFNNIMACIFLDKKNNKISMNYRFAYSDGRKSSYDMKDKDGSIWLKFDTKFLADAKKNFRTAFEGMAELAQSEIKLREIEYTGKEPVEEVMLIMQQSGLMNIATVDTKKQEVKVNDDFDELNL